MNLSELTGDAKTAEQHGSKLVQLLQNEVGSSEQHRKLDPTKLKYAIYARKSTEDEDRQMRSIEDQIADCYDLIIQPQGIRINSNTDVYQEMKSAKESGKRIEFDRLIDAVKAGKYDGIIAWHYDRLARNMKEAGEIIDMVDTGVLKDLRFAKATFENTPNGKMILGINFVLSKHYSDHLSESVARGNKSSTEKGKVLRHLVHGYRIVEGERWLIQDGRNFELIKRAFRLRISEGCSLKGIAEFLQENHYQAYRIKRGNYDYSFTVDDVSQLMKQPIYAGVMVYGKNVVDLRDIDPEFEPLLSEDEYIEMNRSSGYLSYQHKHRAKRTSNRDKSDFLRKFVICGHCSETMSTMVTTKKVGYDVMRFRCLNKECENNNSGPAGSVLRDYAVNFLKDTKFNMEELYRIYKTDHSAYNADMASELKSKKKSLEQSVGLAKRRYDNALDMAADKGSGISDRYTPEYMQRMESELLLQQESLSKTVEGYEESPYVVHRLR